MTLYDCCVKSIHNVHNPFILLYEFNDSLMLIPSREWKNLKFCFDKDNSTFCQIKKNRYNFKTRGWHLFMMTSCPKFHFQKFHFRHVRSLNLSTSQYFRSWSFQISQRFKHQVMCIRLSTTKIQLNGFHVRHASFPVQSHTYTKHFTIIAVDGLGWCSDTFINKQLMIYFSNASLSSHF